MLRSVKELFGYIVAGSDDTVGRVDDFYFDDVTWTIHYLVVDVGAWLEGRRAPVSLLAVRRPDWDGRVFPVNLTREQVEASPYVDPAGAGPFLREHEQALFEHYNWPPYWDRVSPFEASAVGMYPDTYLRAMRAVEAEREEALAREKLDAPTLCSVREVTGYAIEARDDQIGQVDDFLVDDADWSIRYMIVDTGTWWPGKKVLVATDWIEFVNWPESKVHVSLYRETIRNGPEYDPSVPVDEAYETRLYDLHGQPPRGDRR
jgi:hypothetical protein